VAKVFEFLVVEGGTMLRLVEKYQGASRLTFLGEEIVAWFVTTVEELVRREGVRVCQNVKGWEQSFHRSEML
jgi:hypothetical protein